MKKFLTEHEKEVQKRNRLICNTYVRWRQKYPKVSTSRIVKAMAIQYQLIPGTIRKILNEGGYETTRIGKGFYETYDSIRTRDYGKKSD